MSIHTLPTRIGRVTLDLTQAQFEELHRLSDRTKRRPVVRVRKVDLDALLRDHSKVIAILEDRGGEI